MINKDNFVNNVWIIYKIGIININVNLIGFVILMKNVVIEFVRN